MNTTIRLTATAFCLVSSLLLGACSTTTTPNLDASFGKALREARANQTLNPRASENKDPVLGIDGQAGVAAQGRYQESFRAPPQTFEVNSIGGGISGN